MCLSFCVIVKSAQEVEIQITCPGYHQFESSKEQCFLFTRVLEKSYVSLLGGDLCRLKLPGPYQQRVTPATRQCRGKIKVTRERGSGHKHTQLTLKN